MPTDAEIAARLGERLAVKVEQELRSLAARDRQSLLERFAPIVETLAGSEEGRADLAAICAFYLEEHKPETSVTEPEEPSFSQPA